MPVGRRYRLILLGSDEIALPVFKAVLDMPLVEVVGVYTQPDRPAGRGQEIRPNAIALWAKEVGLKLFQPEKLSSSDVQTLTSLDVDLGVVMAYGQILTDEFLATSRLGFINFHGSLLPALRGATPVEGALTSNLKVTGISLQQVVRKLDAGPIHASAELSVAPLEGRVALRERLGVLAANLAMSSLPKILAGESRPVAQDESKVTYTRRLNRQDSAIDFSVSANEIQGRVLALEGWPGSTFEWNGLVIKVGAVMAESSEAPAAPGTVLRADREGLQVACATGVCRFTALQRPGGKMLPVGDFLGGCPITVGAVIKSVSMPPLVGPRPFPKVTQS
jgi:methionyl-tRNA formyltransferase